jgi:hypothetical protein
MFASLATFLLTAALGQAPPEAAWLKSVPAEADVVVHVRGIEAVRDDLSAMIRAMSPALGDQVGPALDQAVDQFTQQMGKPAAQTPFLALVRVQAPEQGGPPFAVIVKSDNYQGVLDSLAGGKAKTKQEPGGLDSLTDQRGQTLYATKGDGWVAFGADSKLVAGVAKPAGKTLADTLPDEMRQRLLSGDVGVYVNLAALQSRYAKEIDDARAQLMAIFDQVGQQAGNAGVMDAAKQIYGGMFDALKVADGLALNLDFAKQGLDLSGEVTLKPDTKTAGPAANGDVSGLAKLPADGSYFVYMNIDPELYARLQSMGMAMMAAGGGGAKPGPAMEKALQLQREAGRIETFGVTRMDNGMRSLNIMMAQDAKKLEDATLSMLRAMKAEKGSPAAELVKNVDVTGEAQKYRDISFTQAKVTFDLEAFAKLQPNPGGAEMLKNMLGGDAMTTWTGRDGPRVVSVAGPDWDAAKAMLDAYYEGKENLGGTAAYQAIRREFPDKATALAFISAQGVVRQLAGQFAAMLQNPELKPPADMPKETTLMGVGLVTSEKGYQFKMVVPSDVGPVFEKGLVPIFRSLQGQVNQ